MQEAGDAARYFHTGSSAPTGQVMTDGGAVQLEGGVCSAVRSELEKRGHHLLRGANEGGYQVKKRGVRLRAVGRSAPRPWCSRLARPRVVHVGDYARPDAVDACLPRRQRDAQGRPGRGLLGGEGARGSMQDEMPAALPADPADRGARWTLLDSGRRLLRRIKNTIVC